MPATAPYADLALGDHVCLPIGSDREILDFAVDFTSIGLRNDEKVVVCVDRFAPGIVTDRLAREVSGFWPATAGGQLAVLACDDVQLAGGSFRPDRLLDSWVAAIEEACAEGYAGLRVCVDMAWGLRVPGLYPLFDFEARGNRLFLGRRMSAVCQYDRRLYDAHLMQRASSAHPITPHQATLRCVLTGDRLTLSGEADATNHHALAAVLSSVSTMECTVTVDASALTFADIAAVRLLAETVADRPGRTAVIGPPWVTWLLDLVGAAS